MKCFEFCEMKKICCKKNDCRYWIDSKENSMCCIIASKKNDNITLEEVGKIFNVTRMRICQIEKRAIEKIKSILMH